MFTSSSLLLWTSDSSLILCWVGEVPVMGKLVGYRGRTEARNAHRNAFHYGTIIRIQPTMLAAAYVNFVI